MVDASGGSPRLAGGGERDLIDRLLKTAETVHVYTEAKILNRLTGEYHIIAKETTYDQ